MEFTQQEKYKDNIVLKLSFEFAKDIVAFSEVLQELKKFTFANQIIRSGTSIGANIKKRRMRKAKLILFTK